MPLAIALTRQLDQGDLIELELPQTAKPATIQRLRDSHHRLARVLASGTTPTEASAITGFSISRISILKSDPTFRSLLEHYRGLQQEHFVDVLKRFESLALDATEELHERLHEKPEDFTVNSLLEVVKVVGDRAGFAPTQKIDQRIATMKLSPGDLEEMKNAERPAGVVRTVERAAAPSTERATEAIESSPRPSAGRVLPAPAGGQDPFSSERRESAREELRAASGAAPTEDTPGD